MGAGIAQVRDISAQKRSRSHKRISFRSVNCKGTDGYDPALQRHHILPRELLAKRCFRELLSPLRGAIGFDDFRFNGLLLPSTDAATLRTGMPLHRGPHRRYNEVVIERVGRIEAGWAVTCRLSKRQAAEDAIERLGLLQSALRRRLLSERRRFLLNRKDPLGTGFDFTELDAMAETLWNST